MEPRRKLAAFLGGPPPGGESRACQLPLSGEMARAGSRGGKAAGELASHAPAPRAQRPEPASECRCWHSEPFARAPLFLCFCQGEPGELGAARCRGCSVPPPSGDTVGSCFESRVKNYTRLRPHVLRLPLHCPRLASRFLPAPDRHSRLLRAIAARQNDCPRRRGRGVAQPTPPRMRCGCHCRSELSTCLLHTPALCGLWGYAAALMEPAFE